MWHPVQSDKNSFSHFIPDGALVTAGAPRYAFPANGFMNLRYASAASLADMHEPPFAHLSGSLKERRW